MAYPFADKEGIKFKERLESTSMPVVKPVELITTNIKPKHLISYLYPIPTNSSVSHGTVTFIVKEETITKLIDNALGDSKGNVYVYNAESELLASANQGSKLSDQTISKLASNDAGIIDMTINKENYSVVTVHSEVSNWTCVMTIDRKSTRLNSSHVAIPYAARGL